MGSLQVFRCVIVYKPEGLLTCGGLKLPFQFLLCMKRRNAKYISEPSIFWKSHLNLWPLFIVVWTKRNIVLFCCYMNYNNFRADERGLSNSWNQKHENRTAVQMLHVSVLSWFHYKHWNGWKLWNNSFKIHT